MKKVEKNQIIDSLTEQLRLSKHIYLTDISDLNSEKSSNLRRLCFKRNVKLTVVKNTLLKRAMENTDKDFKPLFGILTGTTSVMFCEDGSTPAKLIKEFRKSANIDKPILKGAYVEECTYIGNDQLELLISIKSKNELIGDIVALLQSPAKNVIGALQSGGQKLSGIVKTLSERPE